MSESHAATEHLAPRTLGLARWVQLAFMALWVVLLWVFDKIVTIVWDKFAEPKPVLVTLVAVVTAFAATLAWSRSSPRP